MRLLIIFPSLIATLCVHCVLVIALVTISLLNGKIIPNPKLSTKTWFPIFDKRECSNFYLKWRMILHIQVEWRFNSNLNIYMWLVLILSWVYLKYLLSRICVHQSLRKYYFHLSNFIVNIIYVVSYLISRLWILFRS